jgi:hypothetical protein
MRKTLLIVLALVTPGVLAGSVPNSITEYVTTHMGEYEFFSGKLNDWSENSRQFYIKHASSENIYATFTALEPWAVNIDFNGDGKKDWVGFLVTRANLDDSSKRRVSLYCICTTVEEYESILIRKWAWAVHQDNLIGVGVFPAPAGPKFNHFEFEQSANISTVGVTFMNYEKGSKIYFWDEGEVKTFITSD